MGVPIKLASRENNERGRLSIKEFHVLMGRNIDKYLKLSYVMATAWKVDSISNNIELEKSKM